MGKRAKKLKVLAGEGFRNIGDLLQSRPKPKMAAQPDLGLTTSKDEMLETSDDIPYPGDLDTPLPEEDLSAPVNKGAFKALLINIRTLFNADLSFI
ncbi:Hypothetical predicted protein [Pelobates cultripes]|uniref:Uncharacterized protein n=1 Tax=Pelobates cultripes TaxID=61616 RepID=A0AAD1WIG0_PELCU|nr:Hypothetical predicted protein [Pelobates cultripes]